MQQQGAINTMGGKFGLPTNMTKNPAISSSKKASKPFKPPAQGKQDQSIHRGRGTVCTQG